MTSLVFKGLGSGHGQSLVGGGDGEGSRGVDPDEVDTPIIIIPLLVFLSAWAFAKFAVV